MNAIRVALAFVLAFVLSLSLGLPARADHMNGLYYGTGEAEGITLDITQQGTVLRGMVGGDALGRLYGRTDGGDLAFGVLLFDEEPEKLGYRGFCRLKG